MATYQFSALANGQAIGFNPSTDVLNFDQNFYHAADIRVTVEGANLRIGLPGSKEVVLVATNQLQLATTNVTFASGGQLLFGDNTTGTANDNAANSLVGTAGRDHLAGFGGADTLNGGAGDDTYFVSTGDVLVDSGGVDSVFSDVSWSLGAGFEHLTFTGTANASGQGNSLNNSLTGNSGNNYFNGRGGNDTIDGGAGNDTIDMSTGGTTSQGHDIILGGDGIDTVDYDGYARSAIDADLFNGWVDGGGDAGEGSARLISIERLVGGAFNDRIIGSTAANYLDGRGGSDTIDGGAGNDTLVGGSGADTFMFTAAPGGANADQVVGFASGSDKLVLNGVEHPQSGPSGAFSAGDARFWSSAAGTAHDASDRVIYNTSTGQLWYDADGNGSGAALLLATLQGAPALAATDIAIVDGGTTITGTAGNDSLTGTVGNDTMQGLGGNDTLKGEGGADRLEGGDGDDSLYGGHYFDGDRADYYVGGNGNDTLDGEAGSFGDGDIYAETMDGGLGDDLYVVDNSGDVLIDAGGIDTVRAVNLSYTLGAGFENLHINNDEAEFLMTGIGNELDNFMRGGWGVRLEGRGGDDTLEGTSRSDELFGDEGDDDLYGEHHYDQLYGGVGNDTLRGGGDDDSLVGGDGDDWLDGDGGGFPGSFDMDTLTGGAGADNFVFSSRPDEWISGDFVTDFASGLDSLRFDATSMPELGASGRLAAGDGRFHAAAGATSGHDANDRLVYNTTTRELYFDADGSGSQAARLIATLQPGATLAATDIVVDNGTDPNGVHLVGTAGDDTLAGGEGDDTIEGLGGGDLLAGNGGNDYLDGSDTNYPFGTGGDTLRGGAGDDTLASSRLDSELEGGAGADDFLFEGIPITGAFGASVLDFTPGSDRIVLDRAVFTRLNADGSNIHDHISYNTSTGMLAYTDGGGGGAIIAHLVGAPALLLTDIAVVGTPPPPIRGTEGDDSLNGTLGEDTIEGLGGDDHLHGDEGADVLIGGAGNDTLHPGSFGHGDAWSDMLDGGLGDDVYFVFDDGDVIVADAGGHDTVHATGFEWILIDGLEDLFLENADGGGHGVGNGLDNVMRGFDASLEGMGGDDHLSGSGHMQGGDGNDTLDGAGRLFGDAGDDVINGSFEGDPDDQLTGGSGADRFVFDENPFAAGRVTDFASGADTIVLDGEAFTTVGASGRFTAGDARFWASSTGTAHDASDRIIYNTASGELWFDVDGTGAAGPELIAQLDGAPAFTATDLEVVNGGSGAPINGTEGPDSLNGTSGDDVIDGRGGDDNIDGGTGNDTIFGGAGLDALILRGDYGSDELDGGEGSDSLIMVDSTSGIVAELLPDGGSLSGGGSAFNGARLWNIELVSGTDFADFVTASAMGVSIQLDGMEGNDTLAGGLAGDELNGWGGNDLIQGGGGNDTLDGFNHPTDGVDTMEGGVGDDEYYVSAGDVLVESAGNGTDTVFAAASWTLANNVENLTLLPGGVTANGNGLANVLRGNEGNNSSINGRAGNDTMFGMGGNDVFDMSTGGTSSYGNDVIDGGGGTDGVEFGANARTAVNINLASGTVAGGGDGGAGSATLTSIENALGGNFNDTFIGNSGANYFRGSNGNDTLNGGAGNDRLQGDAGNDAFVFDALGTANSDTVIGFASGADKVHLENSVMTALGAAGAFVAGDVRYWEAAGATSGHDANDRIVYNTSTGHLYYDADGSGAGAAQIIAQLQGAPAFTDTDVFVI